MDVIFKLSFPCLYLLERNYFYLFFSLTLDILCIIAELIGK